MRHLDLFSGIGGFSLALESAGMRTVGFCEINPYCRKLLARHWPGVPVFEDIRDLQADDLPETPHIITGGYPCQPFSVAGKQRGAQDDRHLWPEMLRIIKQCRPAWVIAENVTGHIALGLDQVLADLEGEGYACRPVVIPACGVNAPHRGPSVDYCPPYRRATAKRGRRRHSTRKAIGSMPGRVGPKSVGNAEYDGPPTTQERGKYPQAKIPQKRSHRTEQPAGTGGPANSAAMADPDIGGRFKKHNTPTKPGKKGQPGRCLDTFRPGSWWATEPGVGRVADGIPNRVDRIKCLGNSIVPQVAHLIGLSILRSSMTGGVSYDDMLASGISAEQLIKYGLLCL